MWLDQALIVAAQLLGFAILCGLVMRRRAGVCWTFIPYLGVALVADLLMLAWPERFFHLWFYVGKELLIHVLRFALALELTYRTFRAFPSARATVRGALLLVLAVTFVIVLAATGDLAPQEGAPAHGPLVSRVQPRLLNGTIWLLTGVAALILWYRLPVHPFHKAILIGMVPYLLVFTVSLNIIESQGWAIRERVNPFHQAAFVLLLGYWAVAAWRRSEVRARAPAPDPTLRQVTG
jgi:hypothetical protein